MKNLSYLMDHVLYQIFKIILNIYIYIYIYIYKEHNEKLLKRIYINKIENRIKFKIKTGCYLELLTPETMELLKSTN